MQLEQKHWIPVLAILGLLIAAMVVYKGLSDNGPPKLNFKNNLRAQDSLRSQFMPVINGNDSLRVRSFPNKIVILDFWAAYAVSFSPKEHRQLAQLKHAYPDDVAILAADVEDKPQAAKKYIRRHNYPFHYVDGTKLFNRFQISRIPTQLVFLPGGHLQSIFTGTADSTRMDSLRAILKKY